MIQFADLGRNDLEGALRYWRQEREKPSSNDMRFEALAMLFDDPRPLFAAMRRELAVENPKP